MTTHRKLAAILSADAAGYSRLMVDDEAETLRALNEARALFRKRIEAHGGRLIDTAGDSILAEFPSAVEAVDCAVEIQHALAKRNHQLAEHRRMQFRIGINLGDVIEQEDGTIYGDGVNVAARLQQLAEAGGICLSGTAFDQVEGKLPLQFKFIGEQQVKNIAKPVRAYRVLFDATLHNPPFGDTNKRRRFAMAVATAIVLFAALAVFWKTQRPALEHSQVLGPTVAVLPFTNMSGDPRQEYFSDGLTEDIIDSLAQLPDLAVIARNSSFRYKGQAVDIPKAGNELGASFVVEGSVRRSVNTIRISAQVIETNTGSHLWSKSWDRALTAENVFAIQDEIAAAVAAATGGPYGVIHQQALARAKRKPPADINSYDCVLFGMQHTRILSLETHRIARDCLERVVKVDSEYAVAWGMLASIYVNEDRYGYDPRPSSLDRALEAAQRAVELSPNHPGIRVRLALVHFFRGERDAFKAAAEEAVKGGSRSSSELGDVGLYLCYVGEWDRGLAFIEAAKRRDPYFPVWYHNGAFHNHYRKRNYQAALESALRGNLPDFVQSQSQIVAAYGQLGRADEALPYVTRIRELDPNFEATAREHWWKRFRYQTDHVDHLIDGLRKGGLTIPDKKN